MVSITCKPQVESKKLWNLAKFVVWCVISDALCQQRFMENFIALRILTPQKWHPSKVAILRTPAIQVGGPRILRVRIFFPKIPAVLKKTGSSLWRPPRPSLKPSFYCRWVWRGAIYCLGIVKKVWKNLTLKILILKTLRNTLDVVFEEKNHLVLIPPGKISSIWNLKYNSLKINMEHNHGGLEDHFPF